MTLTEARKETEKRFIIMSVPTDDGAYWFVYDKETRRSAEQEHLTAARENAAYLNAHSDNADILGIFQ